MNKISLDDILEDLTPVKWATKSKLRKSYGTTKKGFPTSWQVSMDNSDQLDDKEFNKLLGVYQKRCVKRLATFLKESRRMSLKVREVFAKLKELEVEITSMEVDKNFSEKILNSRRRPRGLRVELQAKKKDTYLYGTLLVTPSSLKLYLGSEKLAEGIPLYSVTYYRNLVIHDNYLAALVKGTAIYGKRRFF